MFDPLYIAVSWVLVTFHSLFTRLGMPSASGVTWTLSIIGLVLVVRTLLIPLFVKQIKSQRALQMLQPEIKELQEKYKHDRERQSRELMQLYKDRKANPFASCLPVLAQAPIFFALFGVLNGISKGHTRGPLNETLVREAASAKLFGAQLFESFTSSDTGTGKAIALVLILLMTASTFLQQRQLLTKGMPASALSGPYAQQQKMLMYILPVVFGLSGFVFPIGVLLYWFTSNMWSLGQQMYVIHRMPAPGSIAEQNLQRRRAEKEARRQGQSGGDAPVVPAASPAGSTAIEQGQGSTRQRQQPRKKPRGKRR